MKVPVEEYVCLLRNDLSTFIERAFYELNPQRRYVIAPHVEAIASKLEQCRSGRIRRLIVNLPPRHLKSHCVTIAFVAWLLGHNAAARIICASYGQDLADNLARQCRNVMTSRWYKQLFKTRLQSERQPVADFTTTMLGTRMATSVGGVLTGRGADLIIIDDPQKPDEALSETRRKAVNDWYDNTLLSRLNNKETGCIIIIMQRLHQDDLVGHVLEQEGWEVLSFPAIAEDDEQHVIEGPLGRWMFNRRKGEALHPARETLITLGRIRETIGEYNFCSQYQQDPTPLGGAMVKRDWLRWYEPGEEPARFTTILQSWDTANKAKDLNDYSVCTTWGALNKHFYLLHVFRERLNYPDLKRAVRDLSNRFGADTALIEDKASGTQLIQDLSSEGVVGILAYEPPPSTDKIMRLHAQTALFAQGNVHLPRNAPWLADYVNELTGFPGTRYDDQVDSTTQALAHLRVDSVYEQWCRMFPD